MDFTPENYKATLQATVDTVAALGTIAGSALGLVTAYSAWKANRDKLRDTIRKRKAAKRRKTYARTP